MTLRHSEHPPPETPTRARPGPVRAMAAGAVGALVLGAGLGLWARPASPSLPEITPVAAEDMPRRALQIVVDDGPAPIGPLLEVLPGEVALAAEGARPPPPMPSPPSEPVAPRPAATGLMKVEAVDPPELLLVPAVKVEPKSKPKPELKKRPLKPKVEKITARPEPQPQKLKVAQTKPKEVEKPKAARDAKAARFARAEKATPAKIAKAETAKSMRLAKVEAPKEKAGREKAGKVEARPKKPATLVKATKAAPKKPQAGVTSRKIEQAQAKPARKPQIAKASAKPAVAKAAAKRPAPRKPVPIGEGRMRVVSNDGCASPDFGMAVVCADSQDAREREGARERQLERAYRNAEAAGVPSSSLRRQQARWQQARAAAAREAPWAVEDAYEAQMSKLNDLMRDAGEN